MKNTATKLSEMEAEYDYLNDLLQAHDDCNGCGYCDDLADRIDAVAAEIDRLQDLLENQGPLTSDKP